MTGTPVCVAPTGDRCGEGAVWDDQYQFLYWTDINRFLIHQYDPVTAGVKSWFFNEPVTAITLTSEDGTLAVVLGSRLILWNPDTDKRTDHLFHLPGWPFVRFNDARVDPRGSLWMGSMRNNVRPDGSPGEAGGTDGILYRLDPGGIVTEWKRDIGIANTLVWSPRKDRFYFADTLKNTIWRYHYDASTGRISNERPALIDFPRGLPDGSAMDSEGFLWNCRFGGSCIVRLDPNDAIDQVIEMPTTNITTCTFGDKDRKTLYVTTASSGAPPGDRLAGSLFAIRTEVTGQPENRFQIVT
jgi:sugar lactone lactonase YvrE